MPIGLVMPEQLFPLSLSNSSQDGLESQQLLYIHKWVRLVSTEVLYLLRPTGGESQAQANNHLNHQEITGLWSIDRAGFLCGTCGPRFQRKKVIN